MGGGGGGSGLLSPFANYNGSIKDINLNLSVCYLQK